MALNVNRWLKYAKDRIDSAVGQGNKSLDQLEAEREVELADKPWLRSDDKAPTFDEARARIQWEADQQARKADREPTDETRAADAPAPEDRPGGPAPRSPQQISEDAERESARLELEERQRRSAERLAAIREELGVEDPPAEG